MKIVHLSDTHLGYQGVGQQRHVEDPDRPGVSLRQQEADILSGFRCAVDRIVAEVHPDVVIHSGDLFDHAHPPPYAVDFAMRQIRRVTEAGIPFVVVEGDHSCPRMSGQGQVLRLLLHIPDVHVACGEAALIALDKVAIYAVPHRAVACEHRFERTSLDARRPNVLLLHAVADGYPFFQTSRHAASYGVRQIAPWFDYVALGHCHRFFQVPHTDRAFYAGSTALVAQGDFRPGYRFGFNVVTLSGNVPDVQRVEVDTRPMHAYGLHDAAGLSAGEVLAFLHRQVEALPPKEAYCHLVLAGLDPLARKELSVRDLYALFEGSASLVPHIRVRELTSDEVVSREAERSPQARFRRLAQEADGPPDFVNEVCALGLSLLDKAQSALNADADPEEV